MKRWVLITLVVTLATANGLYFYVRSKSGATVFEAQWIGYMPELEASQLNNPIDMLESSHHRDPRYPELYAWDTGKTYPKFSRWAAECGVRDYIIDKYVYLGREATPHQMPDRFYTKSLSPKQANCLRKSLPSGYVLKKLKKPTRLPEIGWDSGVRTHLANGKNNAQTH